MLWRKATKSHCMKAAPSSEAMRTVTAGRHGNQPVDTGFIVFNYANYPNLTKLFEDLNVPVCKSNMSWCCCGVGNRICAGNIGPVFAQKNLLNPKFLRMAADILSLMRGLATANDPTLTLNFGKIRC